MERIDQLRKFAFIKKCSELRHDLRFQCWDSKAKDISWYTFEELKQKGRMGILFHCNELLRNSIETKYISEFRIDIDKSLEECINIAKEINNKLSLDNIKVTWYQSGGSGIHGGFLFNVNKFKLNNKNYNKERTPIRKLIAEHYKITKIDPMLFGSEQQLTLEGAIKRRNIDKKGNVIKIYNKRKILININETKEQILQYISRNDTKVIMNENYFNEINELSTECIKFVNDELKTFDNEPLKENVKYNVLDNYKESTTRQNYDSVTINHRYYTLALIKLYKLHDIKSQHNYIFYLLRLFNDLGLNEEDNVKEVELIINKLNLTNNDNLDNQYKYMLSRNTKVWYGFKQTGEKRGEGGYSDIELHTLVNKFKYELPKEVLR